MCICDSIIPYVLDMDKFTPEINECYCVDLYMKYKSARKWQKNFRRKFP